MTMSAPRRPRPAVGGDLNRADRPRAAEPAGRGRQRAAQALTVRHVADTGVLAWWACGVPTWLRPGSHRAGELRFPRRPRRLPRPRPRHHRYRPMAGRLASAHGIDTSRNRRCRAAAGASGVRVRAAMSAAPGHPLRPTVTITTAAVADPPRARAASLCALRARGGRAAGERTLCARPPARRAAGGAAAAPGERGSRGGGLRGAVRAAYLTWEAPAPGSPRTGARAVRGLRDGRRRRAAATRRRGAAGAVDAGRPGTRTPAG